MKLIRRYLFCLILHSWISVVLRYNLQHSRELFFFRALCYCLVQWWNCLSDIVLTQVVLQNLTDDGLSCIAMCKNLVSLNLTWYVTVIFLIFIWSRRRYSSMFLDYIYWHWQVRTSHWCWGHSNSSRLQVSWITKVNLELKLSLKIGRPRWPMICSPPPQNWQIFNFMN